jgi:hypothetical protein
MCIKLMASSVLLLNIIIPTFVFSQTPKLKTPEEEINTRLSQSYNTHPQYIKKQIKDFFKTEDVSTGQDEQSQILLSSFTIDLGNRYSDFYQLHNIINKQLTVSYLMQSTAQNGLPNFGPSTSATNLDVRNMLFFILKNLHDMKDQQKSDRTFKKLALAFTNCQQVQYRVVQDIYLEMMNRQGLSTRVALLIDTLKTTWLMQTIFKMEKKSTMDLDPHVQNSYLKAIGKEFGITGWEEATVDALATKVIDATQASANFKSLIQAEEIINAVYDEILSSTDAAYQAEIYRWASERDYDLEAFYDENLKYPKKDGVAKILEDMGVVVAQKKQGVVQPQLLSVGDKVFHQKDKAKIISVSKEGVATIEVKGSLLKFRKSKTLSVSLDQLQKR